MTIPPFPELYTQRLVLMRLQDTDWEVLSFLRSDTAVNAFVDRPPAETQAAALAFIQKINTAIDTGHSYYCKLTERGSPTMIGSICLWNFSTDRQTAEIGYDLSPTHQGKGLMTEAIHRIIDFGFHTLKLEALEAYTHHQNKRSRTVLERTGFTLLPDKKDPDVEHNVVYELKKAGSDGVEW